MDPRSFGHTNAFLDNIDEGRRVVIGDLLSLVHGRDELEVDHGTSSPKRRDVVGG